MPKSNLQAPPLRKDGLQLDEKRSFHRVFWTAERYAWVAFGLILVMAAMGLTGSGGFFARATANVDTGKVEYSRVSRWESSDELRITFDGGGETRQLAMGLPFFEYFQVEGIQPQPERTSTSRKGVVMEFAAEQDVPVEVILYLRPLHPGLVSFNAELDGSATNLNSIILP